MIRRNLLTLAVLLAVGTAAAAALAQTPTTPQERPMRADTNNDGYIDRSEAAAMPRLAERFDTMDADKDGRLSRQEMPGRKAGHGGYRGKAGGGHGGMMKLDTDGDGRISRAEAAAGSARMVERFDTMDFNKDGFVDRADHQQRAKQRSGEWFTSADSNKDGQLSRAEFDAAHAKRMQEGRMGKGPAK